MAARFVLCSCKKHGRIFIHDAREEPGAEFGFQMAGFVQIQKGLADGYITPTEMRALSEQIETSGLPVGFDDADIVLLYLIELFNGLIIGGDIPVRTNPHSGLERD